MKFVIVIPTYNEAENIAHLIDVLNGEFKNIGTHDFHILVVEGNSPDGTAEIVKKKQSQYNNLHLLVEKEKAGLGAAYMYGFKYALANLDPDVLVEMDADFQHDPKDLVKLVEGIEDGYDYVIGSRYVRGGSIPKEWGFHRKFLSVVGNWVAMLVLGVFSVKDFTTGYKASKVRGFVDKLADEEILSSGFAYKIDLLYRMHKLGAKIKEVPIDFGVRDRGDSKMQQNNAIDSLKVVFMLRIKENISFFKFCVVGLIGFITDIGLANLLVLTPLRPNLAATSSALVAMLVTYYLNNSWSFSEKRITSVSQTIKSILIYIAFSSVPIIFRFWFVGYIIIRFGTGVVPYNFSILVSIVLGLIWNYTIYSRIIWRKN